MFILLWYIRLLVIRLLNVRLWVFSNVSGVCCVGWLNGCYRLMIWKCLVRCCLVCFVGRWLWIWCGVECRVWLLCM